MGQLLRAPLSPLVAGEQQLSRELGGYLVRVLRLRAGDAFVLFDPEAGTEADAEVLRDIPAVVRVGEPRAAARVTRREVVLLQGFAKGDKPEQVLRAAVALGASAVTFVRTERSVAGAELRLERLRAVMLDAARQCGRGDLPTLGGLVDFEASLGEARGLLLMLEPTAARSLVEVMRDVPRDRALTLAVGPEGGFGDDEAAKLVAAGFEAVRLAPFVLRTELAAVAALSVVAAHE
jgi:16S rRNA (uracil1498-N3)-methyltransferase